jgi:hypothetical protein
MSRNKLWEVSFVCIIVGILLLVIFGIKIPEKQKGSAVQDNTIDRVLFEGHTYIRAKWCSSVSIVHDLDCKCKKEK